MPWALFAAEYACTYSIAMKFLESYVMWAWVSWNVDFYVETFGSFVWVLYLHIPVSSFLHTWLRKQSCVFVTVYLASPCTSFVTCNFWDFKSIFSPSMLLDYAHCCYRLDLCPKSIRHPRTTNVVVFIASIIHTQHFRMQGEAKRREVTTLSIPVPCRHNRWYTCSKGFGTLWKPQLIKKLYCSG